MENIDRVRLLNYLTTEIDALYHQAAVKLGMSDSVLTVLYMLYEQDGSCLLSEIYKKCGISKQTVNSALRKLEADGISYLEPYKGNAKKIVLTAAGKQYAQATIAKLYEAEMNAFASWSDEEVETYIRLIRKELVSLREQLDKMPQISWQRE